MQTQEYSVDRQNVIHSMIENINSVNKEYIINEIVELKKKLNEKTIMMKHIQELIPKEGIATNYRIQTNNNDSCSKSARLT